jgi:hypothetical protein
LSRSDLGGTPIVPEKDADGERADKYIKNNEMRGNLFVAWDNA